MIKIRSILVAVTIILLIFPSLASASYDEFEVDHDNVRNYINQPKTLDDAVDEIKQLINEGKSRWYIAARVTTIADIQIVNKNDDENLGASWKQWLLGLAGESDEEKKFEKWRAADGAEAQYDDAAKWVWGSRYGMCAENSALVYYLLKEAGAKDLHLIIQDAPGYDHRYVIWGMDEGNPNKPESWTNDVIVPDGWQHKVLRGKAAFNNKYCLHGGKAKFKGVTDTYDLEDGKKICGFLLAPCCKKIEPCRGVPDLVCAKSDNKCHPCGNLKQYCCEGEKCNFETLECVDGKCVKKSKEEEDIPIGKTG